MKENLSPELISALLGLFAHDLRNPLSALHSNVSFLASVLSPGDNDAREALEDVAASSDALGHITDNLELFAFSLEDVQPREAQNVLLAEVLRDTAQKARRFADSYRVVLNVELESASELRVLANREMLLRALGNLVRNAVQHAGENGKVSVEARRSGGEVVVSVRDSGTGLAPEVALDAFTAAGQLATKNLAGGRYSRGLGLFTARVAAELAGASVRSSAAPEPCLELCLKAS